MAMGTGNPLQIATCHWNLGFISFSMGEFRTAHDHFEEDRHWLLDWRGARRWLAGSYDRDALSARAGDAGGELWQLRGAENGADVFPERGAAYRNMLLRLKQALDPGGIFNPGRLYSRL